MEESGGLNDVVENLHYLLLGHIELEELGENLLIEEKVCSGLTGMVLVAHLHSLGKDGLGCKTAHILCYDSHNGKQLLTHITEVVCDLLAVKSPAAESALVGALSGEGSRDLTGSTVLGNDHCNALGNDTGTCTDGVGVKCGEELDLTACDKLHSLFLVLCPAFKQAGGNKAAAVEHYHILVLDRRTGVDDGVIVKSLNDLACGLNVNPIGLRVYYVVYCSFVCSVDLCLDIGCADRSLSVCNLCVYLEGRTPLKLSSLYVLRYERIVEELKADVDNAKIAGIILICHCSFPLICSQARS